MSGAAQEKEEKKKEEVRPGLPTDVPVTKPLSPTKGADDPPVVPKETPQETPIVVDHALLPPTLIKNIVANVKVGQNVYVGVQALKVDYSRKTWLQPAHITGAKSAHRVISLKREDDGFHVVIERMDHQWEAEDFDGAALKWIPVRSLKVKE